MANQDYASPSLAAILHGAYVRTWPERYELLDGLRGLACVGVLLHHLGVVGFGHYCVMIFFVISGYCITASAQSGLRRGTSFGIFMMRRVRRIYPPYLLAIAFFALTRLIKSTLDGSSVWRPAWSDWLQNLTLTQWLSVPFQSIALPGDNPKLFVSAFWSLNYEEQFYLIMGIALLVAGRFGIRLARSVLALLVVGLAWNVARPGSISGFFLDYWVHFALGSCLYFVLCGPPRLSRFAAFLAGMLLLGIFSTSRLLPWQGSETETAQRVYVELAVLSAMAVMLLLVRPFSEIVSRNVLWKPVAAIGAISYSLYLVHQFNLTLVSTIVAGIVPHAMPAGVVTAVKVLIHLCIGAAFWYVCERPFLSRKPLSHETAVPVSVAHMPKTLV